MGKILGIVMKIFTGILLGFAVCVAQTGSVYAAQSRSSASSSSPGIIVQAVQMPAWIEASGIRRPVSPGDAVGASDLVVSGDKARVLARMPDGSFIKLGENAQLQVKKLNVVVENLTPKMSSDMKLLRGMFRFATQAVDKVVARRELNLELATATIGIRGTDFWSMTDAVHDAVCLFEGKVDVATNEQGVIALDKPSAFYVRNFDKPLQAAGVATQDELARFIASTDLQPGQGVAVLQGRWRAVLANASSAGVAARLVGQLADLGYAATSRSKPVAGRTVYEVRISNFATPADAQSVLDKLSAMPALGLSAGRVALSAASGK
ncbi:MAG: FecR domain-containing protein [Polaromonas sp.]|nr:FecR domain-containing protein [Polaromonas sp.]